MSGRRTRGQERLAWIGTAAGVLSLAGVGYYWYHRWSQSSAEAESSAAGTKNAMDSAPSTSSNRPRPSLSLHLPPSIQDDDSIKELLAFCEQVSALYLLHVIHCDPDGSTAMEQQLQGIPTLDLRRILAYSQHNGGVAVTRALGCEAHVQILTRTVGDSTTTTEEMTTSLQLISKNPTLKLLVLILAPAASSAPTLDLDSIATSLQEARSNDTTSHGPALRVIDCRSSKSWGTVAAHRMADFRKAWR